MPSPMRKDFSRTRVVTSRSATSRHHGVCWRCSARAGCACSCDHLPVDLRQRAYDVRELGHRAAPLDEPAEGGLRGDPVELHQTLAPVGLDQPEPGTPASSWASWSPASTTR